MRKINLNRKPGQKIGQRVVKPKLQRTSNPEVFILRSGVGKPYKIFNFSGTKLTKRTILETLSKLVNGDLVADYKGVVGGNIPCFYIYKPRKEK